MKKKYHKILTRQLRDKCNIKGKNILEIGGDVSCAVAKHLIENGAAHVTSINIDSRFSDREIDGNISTRKLSATEVSKFFAQGTFDLIYGYAVLEHIKDTALLLQELQSILKQDGFLYIHGGPIWTSARGHHVWVDGVEDSYRFNNKRKNPIENWYHLIFTPEEMKHYLAERNISIEDAERIIHYIYHSSDICRIGHADLLDEFYQCDLKMLEVTQSYGAAQIDDEVRSRLNKIYQDKTHDYSVESVNFLLQKV